MATQRNIGRDILDGIAELKRGQHGRITNLPSVSSVREKTGLSQLEFAAQLGVSGDATPPHPAVRPTAFSPRSRWHPSSAAGRAGPRRGRPVPAASAPPSDECLAARVTNAWRSC